MCAHGAEEGARDAGFRYHNRATDRRISQRPGIGRSSRCIAFWRNVFHRIRRFEFMTAPAVRTGWETIGILFGLIAASLNQRPPLVAVGVLTTRIRDDTGLTASTISILTTLPLLCFGVVSACAARASARWGLNRTLVGALLILGCGIAVRALPSLTGLFIGTALAGAGIAVTNVLLPSVIKRDYPTRVGLMMGVYSLCLNGGAALAAGISVPISAALHDNWRAALAVWGLLTLAALASWIPRAIRPPTDTTAAYTGSRMWRSSLAWSVAGYMAVQSLIYYALIAWLPAIVHDAGNRESTAALCSAAMSATGMLTSLAVPIIAVRLSNQRPLVLTSALGFGCGLTGLLLSPGRWETVWAILLGAGQGSGIGLALSLFVLRSHTAKAAAALSGMAQTVGYLTAAVGPLVVGAVHDGTGAWTVPTAILLICTLTVLLVGWPAAAARKVDGAE